MLMSQRMRRIPRAGPRRALGEVPAANGSTPVPAEENRRASRAGSSRRPRSGSCSAPGHSRRWPGIPSSLTRAPAGSRISIDVPRPGLDSSRRSRPVSAHRRAPDDRHSQAGSPVESRREGLKTRARSSASCRARCREKLIAIPGPVLAARHGERAAPGIARDGVARDVLDDLPDLVGVAGDLRRRRHDVELEVMRVGVISSLWPKRSIASGRRRRRRTSRSGAGEAGRNRRKSSRIFESRFDSAVMISMSRRSGRARRDISAASTCTDPEIDASGLRISCAIPAASEPTAGELLPRSRLALEPSSARSGPGRAIRKPSEPWSA